MKEYNIYCDESCHLYYDNSDFLILGALQCTKILRKNICENIRSIKKKHKLDENFEIKWTKVGKKKIEFYEEIIDFFLQSNLIFECLIVSNKKDLTSTLNKNTATINNNYNLCYYSAYYALLNDMINPLNVYNIYMDIKDTNGGKRIHQLHEVLCNNVYDFKKDVIKRIQLIRSEESEILQLTDLLIGAIGYYNRNQEVIDSGLYTSNKEFNLGKIDLINKIKKSTGLTLSDSANNNNFKIITISFKK